MPLLWGRETTGVHLLHTVRPSAATNRRVRPHHSAMLTGHCECGETKLAAFKWCSRCVMFNRATGRQASNAPRRRPEQPQRASLINVATAIVQPVNASASTASWQWARRRTTTTASSTTGEHTSRNKPERTTHSEHQTRPGYHRSRTARQIFQHACRNSYAKQMRLPPPRNQMTSRTRYQQIVAIHGSLNPGRCDGQQRQPRNLDLHQKRP